MRCANCGDSRADSVRAVFEVRCREVDELCDFVHVALVKTSCCGGRRSEAQTACDKRGLGVVGYDIQNKDPNHLENDTASSYGQDANGAKSPEK